MSDFEFWLKSGMLNSLSESERSFVIAFLASHPEFEVLSETLIHSILERQSEQADVALGYSDNDSLRRIRALYTDFQGVLAPTAELEDRLAQAFGDEWAFVRGWMRQVANPTALAEFFEEHLDVIESTRALTRRCPALFDCADFASTLQGETPLALEMSQSVAQVASWGQRSDLSAAMAWALNGAPDLAEARLRTVEALLKHVMGRLCVPFDVLLTGRHAEGTATLGDPIEVGIVSRFEESQVADIAEFWSGMERAGFAGELKVVFRFADYDQLRRYELESMSLAERFALRTVVSVWGSLDAERVMRSVSVALPLTPERLRELAEVKRTQISQVMPQYRHRHVTEGIGALGDIEWFVRLHEMRYPTASRAGAHVKMADRIQQLAHARLINAVEYVEFTEALAHLVGLRHRLVMLGFRRDLIPENPDKLSVLALQLGFKDGNAFLAYHERVTATVHTIFMESLERLKA